MPINQPLGSYWHPLGVPGIYIYIYRWSIYICFSYQRSIYGLPKILNPSPITSCAAVFFGGTRSRAHAEHRQTRSLMQQRGVSGDSWMYPDPNISPIARGYFMGYNPQKSLENINTMGTRTLGVHPIVPWGLGWRCVGGGFAAAKKKYIILPNMPNRDGLGKSCGRKTCLVPSTTTQKVVVCRCFLLFQGGVPTEIVQPRWWFPCSFLMFNPRRGEMIQFWREDFWARNHQRSLGSRGVNIWGHAETLEHLENNDITILLRPLKNQPSSNPLAGFRSQVHRCYFEGW